MRPLNATELLLVWERNFNYSLIEQSLHLLTAACSVNNINEMARLHIGERDARLFQLQEWMFGSKLLNTATCPKCAMKAEWDNDIRDLRFSLPSPAASNEARVFEMDGFSLRFRLPDSYDMLLTISNNQYKAHPEQLLYGCILSATHHLEPCKPTEIPGYVMDALDSHMSENDPQANIEMLVNCPECEHQWTARFDIVSYLLTEINHWATNMLHDIYVLAKAFGWSEHDILQMSAQRRQLYLEMVSS